MQQYWEIKAAHNDKVVLFRMGDFFEMFHRDAEIAAPILGIALTSRDKKAEVQTPMCGVPHHSIGPQINKLLAAGYRVAICDQLEDPKLAKGLVKRGVNRILTPGVVYDPDTLDSLTPNYLASFDKEVVAFLDVSSGEAFYYNVREWSEALKLIKILRPAEIVLDPESTSAENKSELAQVGSLMTEFANQLPQAVSEQPKACSLLLSYTAHLQGAASLALMPIFEKRDLLNRLEISPTVIRHLEVFETTKGEARGSLFHSINRCKSSAGARLLKQWLSFPLAQKQAIENRLDHVQFYFEQSPLLEQIRQKLGALGDIERRLGKIANPSCHPRDLIALAESLQTGVAASVLAKHKNWSKPALEKALKIASQILQTIVDEPPSQIKNGAIIRSGTDGTLDELIDLSTNSQTKVLELEAREKELTGISSLKVRFNSVFGYYIEITHTHKSKVPTDRYERKQTLANAERYTTPELSEIEQKVLTAQARRVELELAIFEDLRRQIQSSALELLTLAREWAELDVLTSFAWIAIEQNYSRPSFNDVGNLRLEGSRHPVVEQSLKIPFVANSLELKAHHCLLLTGPNMAGKSTLMRQVAITSLMAQAGGFVPALRADLPIYDRFFTRIGASDFLSEGLSTFMVEMQETAEMLHNASARSLVILDEVGRGTSTYDGMSLAQAILEHLLGSTQAMVLFATHYHELTTLVQQFPQVHNAHMAIHEKSGQITFLHSLVPGAANKSYGIHVANLAGIPKQVTARAQTILKSLEKKSQSVVGDSLSGQLGLFESSAIAPMVEDPAISLFKDEINSLNLSQMTPLAALNLIANWKDRLLPNLKESGQKSQD